MPVDKTYLGNVRAWESLLPSSEGVVDPVGHNDTFFYDMSRDQSRFVRDPADGKNLARLERSVSNPADVLPPSFSRLFGSKR